MDIDTIVNINSPTNNHNTFMLNCSICDEKVRISEFEIYSIYDSEVMGLTHTNFPACRFGTEYKKYLYPIVWEEQCYDTTTLYTICSNKCARKFWYDRHSPDVEESITKKMRIQ